MKRARSSRSGANDLSTLDEPGVPTTAALIALDWSSSSFRASLMDREGTVLESRACPRGVNTVLGRSFETVVLDFCEDWMACKDIPVLASGMIGSKEGWYEAPHLHCPATLEDAAKALTKLAFASRAIHLVPGLSTKDSRGYADVMQGEETQLWGASPDHESCCVLPGPHSKWAWINSEGGIVDFETFATGELYSALANPSTIGRAMTFGKDDLGHFVKGVRRGLTESQFLMHSVFTSRAMCVTGEIESASLPDYLSGLLIGCEIAGVISEREVSKVILIGCEALMERYFAALEIAGISASKAPPFAAEQGLFRIARAAGLLS